MTRCSGISVPLFSLVTSRSWGVGEFPDLVPFAHWAAAAGQSIVQILPVMELPDGERSPYSALTSFALDPTSIALPEVPEFVALGGEAALSTDDRARLAAVRGAPAIRWAEVRDLKQRWLRRAWTVFRESRDSAAERHDAFAAFCREQAWWLDDYAVFRAILASQRGRAWWEWPAGLREADEAAVAAAAVSLADEADFRRYLQWVAHEQWRRAREQARPVRVLGDLPFMISGNSADVWRHQPGFHLDATVGAPPDAFARDGQDWGLPPWRWQAMAESGFAWMRQRARRHADLFDGFRIDHLVGLYRAWIRPVDRARPPYFDPPDEPTQSWLGETIVGAFTATGAEVIAEDLGTVPDFVRHSLTRLGVPGFKVLRWERHWDQPGHPPIDPATFPELSVATTGTHDIDPLAAELPPAVVHATVRELLGARSSLALVPLQDVFAWPDRINTPSVVDDHNWTWRVPRPVDTWGDWPDAREAQARLRDDTRAAGR